MYPRLNMKPKMKSSSIFVNPKRVLGGESRTERDIVNGLQRAMLNRSMIVIFES